MRTKKKVTPINEEMIIFKKNKRKYKSILKNPKIQHFF